MRQKLILTLLLIIMAFVLFVPEAEGQAYAGIVSLDSAEVERGEHFGLAVRLNGNDIDIAGLMVPLRYPSSELTVDSVTFEGSFITSDYEGGVFLGELDLIQITYLLSTYQTPLPAIPAPNGIIATIYFTVSADASPGVITIDSVNQEDTVWRKIHLSDETGYGTFLPAFVEGVVTVKMPLGVDDKVESGLPSEFSLSQNYPNPFNPTTVIEFALPAAGHVELQIFNILGQSVKTLVDGSLGAGIHRVEFDASEQPSGIYFYRLTHDEATETKKMILVK